MVLVGVHAAIGDQAHKVARAPGAPGRFDQLLQRRRLGQATVANRGSDARQFLPHHPAGADVEVADFGVAHLPVWQSHVVAVRAQESVRAGLP